MPTEILTKSGTPIVWNNAVTNYGLEMAGMVANTGVQGAKGDLGATRAREFDVDLVVQTATAPTAGGTYDLYWSPSVFSTANSGNPGGCTGASGNYSGQGVDSITNSVKQLSFIGALTVTNNPNARQSQHFVFAPSSRYGSPVVINKTDQTNNASVIEHQLKLTPIIYESQ